MANHRNYSLGRLLAVSLFLAGCSSHTVVKPAYESESFSPQSPFLQHFRIGPLAACHLGRRALLSQGYLIESGESDVIRGGKSFQREGNRQLRLDITLYCMPDSEGSILYANALQSRFEVKTSSNSSGLTVAGVGSISLPWSEGKEALIKVGEETVTDPEFYARFFELVKSLAE